MFRKASKEREDVRVVADRLRLQIARIKARRFTCGTNRPYRMPIDDKIVSPLVRGNGLNISRPFILALLVACAVAPGYAQYGDAGNQGESAHALGLGETPRPIFMTPDSHGNLAAILAKYKIFRGHSVSTIVRDRQAVVSVHGYPPQSANYRIDAVAAARAICGANEGKFLTVAVRYLDAYNSRSYRELIVSSRDITSLNAGTIKAYDLALQLPEISIQAQDSPVTIFEKYLAVAETQIDKANYWEAEQIVDSVGGAPPGTNHTRYMRDMINLSQGFDSYGNLGKATSILERVVAQRREAGSLSSSEADATVQRLVDLYLQDNRYKEADSLLCEVINGTPAGARESESYANSLERLAVVRLRQGQNEDALKTFNEVLQLRESKVENAAASARTLENLGDAYKALGKRSEALGSYKRARSIYDKAVVSTKREGRMDYEVYAGRVKQLDEKLKRL